MVFTLPVPLLCDEIIESGDYESWAATVRVIKSHPVDRKILDELLASIPEEGVLEPLKVGCWESNGSLYLSDGHHRAVALMELGIKTFPYVWGWKRKYQTLDTDEPKPLPEWLIENMRCGL